MEISSYSTKNLANTAKPNSKLTKNAKSIKASILDKFSKEQVQAELARRNKRGVVDVDTDQQLQEVFRNLNRSLPPAQKKPPNRWLKLLKDRHIDWKGRTNEFILEKLAESKPKTRRRQQQNKTVEEFTQWLLSQPNRGVGKVLHITFIDEDGVLREWYYNIREGNINRLLEALETHDIEGFGSDAGTVQILEKQIVSYSLEDPRFFADGDRRQTRQRNGGFFKYKHNISNSLIKNALYQLQIYDYNEEIEHEKCFIQACKGQVPDSIIEKMHYVFLTEKASATDIDKFGKENNIYFTIREVKTNGDSVQKRPVYKGKKDATHKVDICLIDEHYFIYVPSVGFTEYYLLNYQTLDQRFRLRTSANNRHDSKGMDSFNLVLKLLQHKDKFLSPIDTAVLGTQFKQDHKIHQDLDLKDNSRRVIQVKSKELEINEYDYPEIIMEDQALEDAIDRFVDKKSKSYDFWGTFDTETYNETTQQGGQTTKVYLIKANIIKSDHILNENNKPVEYSIGENLLSNTYTDIYTFINSLVDLFGIETTKIEEAPSIKLYAHNLTFDLVHVLKRTFIKKTVIKDNKFVCATALLSRKKKSLLATFVDSYRMIDKPLSKFGECFGLDVEKEAMYYEMFNEITAKSDFNLHKDDVKKYIEKFNDISLLSETELAEKEKQFWENTHKWDCWYKSPSTKDTLNLKKYSQRYCEIDCDVLLQGLVKFDKLLKQLDTRLDINDHVSQSALADYYYKINGCYNNVYELSGFLGDYFQGAVVGGRCMLRDNTPQIVIDFLQDFDAVNLYASAMYLMDGFIQGSPKLLNSRQLNMEFLKLVTHYFVTIVIKHVGVRRHMPLMSIINEDGTREWTNDMVGQTVTVDRYALEDLIEFQKIEFDIIEGYYFNDGYNTKIREVVMSLFQQRLIAKKNKNTPLSDVLKLLMNSAYGKTLQKPVDEDCSFRLVKDFEKTWFLNHRHQINYFQYVDDSDYVFVNTTKSIMSDYSRPHIGATVLSYSKRIMNRVICLAEDNNINIYYQDTDSMHILEKDLEPLQILYKNKYNQDLVGEGLGQFHSDFALNGAKKNIRSTHFIGLAKKCYFDLLQGETATGEIINGFHARMKSVPVQALLHEAERFANTKDTTGLLNMYTYMSQGFPVEFDCGVGGKIRFSVDMRAQVYKVAPSIKRCISFHKPDEEEPLLELNLDNYWKLQTLK